jgi:hypothetical protein
VHVCSIMAGVSAAALRVTVDGVLRAHPGATVHVVDIDGLHDPFEGVQLLTPADIGVVDADLRAAAMLAEPAALATWVLPRLLVHFAAAGTPVVYLAPGTRVLGSLAELLELGRTAGVGVVARRDRLAADDGRTPGPQDLQDSGPFHTCVLAVGAAAAPLLASWVSLSDPGRTPSWQTAVAAGPHGLLPAGVVLSRWNVDDDTAVLRTDAGWTCDGTVSALADLTTFDASRPWLISSIDQETARTRLSAHPDLRMLCAQHAIDLDAAAGSDVSSLGRFSRTAAGFVVHSPIRRAYRDAVDAWHRGAGDHPPDPFDDTDPGKFTRWLCETVSSDATPLTRYLRAIYDDRPDLHARYPHVPGRDTPLLVDWAERHARQENNYSAELIDAAIAAARASASSARARRMLVPRRSPAGVNVVGYLQGELGIGESARLMLRALEATHVPYSTTSVETQLQSRLGVALGVSEGSAQTYDVTLVCVNADRLGAVAETIPSLMTGTFRVGMWYWEVEDFPPTMHSNFGLVDEVWVASDFVRAALAPHTRLRVVTVPPPLPQAGPTTTLTRADLGLPADRPVLLFSFDYLSTAERKNPIGLINAFRRAFSPDEGPVLVLKSINADKRVGDAERVRLRAADEPDVLLFEKYLSAEARDALVQLCDVYVSLHRSEGLGLTIAEAMALGKPVIATGYSGNLQFMTKTNSFLVPWSDALVPENCAPYPAGTRWAEPDLDEAARLMRFVIENPEAAAARGQQAARDVRELHSPEVAGRAVIARLEEIRRGRSKRLWLARAQRVRHAVSRAI